MRNRQVYKIGLELNGEFTMYFSIDLMGAKNVDIDKIISKEITQHFKVQKTPTINKIEKWH